MMNCWKAINVHKQYGTHRMFILSCLTVLIAFIFLYGPATYLFVPNTLNDNYFFLLIIGLWLMYPVHKLLHFLPLAPLGRKIKKKFLIKYRLFPIIQIRVDEPISKWIFILSLIAPFFMINSVLIASCYIFTHYVHYFIILLAYHIGLCVSDFIFMRNVLTAPNRAYIEENDEGFEILVVNNDL
jgi:hypothetical protein